MTTTPLPSTGPDRRTRLLGIAAAIGAITAVGGSMGLGLPLLAIVLEGRGVSPTLIGLNTATAGVAALAVTPFAPRLAHRFGTARVLAAVLLVAAACFPLFFVLEHIGWWFLLRLVFHGSINVAFILSEFWMNALAPPARRGLVMGVYATMLSAGFALGPAVLGLVGSVGATPFVVGAAVMALGALPVLLAGRADPGMDEEPKGSILRFVALVPLATFAALAMGATESGVLSLVAVYGLRLGYDEAMAALLVSAVVVGNMGSQIPLGLLSDRMDRRLLLLAIAVCATILAVVIPSTVGSPAIMVVFLAAWGGVAAGLYTVGLTHLGARLSGTDLASANAAFILMYALGMLVGPASLGVAMDLVPPHGLFFAAAAFTLAYAVLAAWRLARPPAREASRIP